MLIEGSSPPRSSTDDSDYEYVWSAGDFELPIPRWLAEILEIPLMVRLEIFMIGAIVGLVVAGAAVLIGMYAAYG